MEKLDETRLELDLAYRYEFLKTFMGFGEEDVAAIRKVASQLLAQIPAIVEEQYDKLLAYDATARHFVEPEQGYEGPEDPQVRFRRDHMQRYLMQLFGHSFNEKIALLFDAVGKMHTPKTGNPKINVPLVQMDAFMGMIADVLTRRLLALDTDAESKLTCLRAFHKILWIQHDFVTRHYAAADIRSLIGSMPLFIGLPIERIEEVARLLRPCLVEPGKHIVHRGDPGDSMFFITSGFVEVRVEPDPIRLGTGDFFGEIALALGRPRTADVVTLGYCQFLELRRDNFQQLLETQPGLIEQVRRIAEARLNAEVVETEDPLKP
jgi:CRP-like cAMP-binding protein